MVKGDHVGILPITERVKLNVIFFCYFVNSHKRKTTVGDCDEYV